MRLRLPMVLVATVIGTAAVVACKGESEEHYFCFPDETLADAGPGGPDASVCEQVVTDPADCPPGCVAEPLG